MSSSVKSANILGNADVRGTLILKGHTFAQLPTGPTVGMVTLVTDATTASGTVSAGGSTHVSLIAWTGSLWTTLLNLS